VTATISCDCSRWDNICLAAKALVEIDALATRMGGEFLTPMTSVHEDKVYIVATVRIPVPSLREHIARQGKQEGDAQ